MLRNLDEAASLYDPNKNGNFIDVHDCSIK